MTAVGQSESLMKMLDCHDMTLDAVDGIGMTQVQAAMGQCKGLASGDVSLEAVALRVASGTHSPSGSGQNWSGPLLPANKDPRTNSPKTLQYRHRVTIQRLLLPP